MNTEKQSESPNIVAMAAENLGAFICIGLIFLALALEKGASQIILLPFGIIVIRNLLDRLGYYDESDDYDESEE